MEPAQKPFVFNNFEITLSIIDARLRIEAIDLSSGYEFFKLLDNSSAKQLSVNYPLDIEKVHQLLKDFFEGKLAKAQLSLSLDGKLEYSCLMPYEDNTKELKFTIQLEKKEIDPLKRLERSLLNKLADLQKTLMVKLEAMDNRIKKLEEKVFPSLTPSPSSTYSPTFNPAGRFSIFYNIVNNDRTASAKTTDPYCLFAREPIPKDKIVRFSFLIEKENFIMVGIAPTRAFGNNLAYEDELIYAYTTEGDIYRAENQIMNLNKYKTGDKISFTVDLTGGEVFIELNGNYCHKDALNTAEFGSNDFYPFIYTRNAVGAGATLLG